MDCVKLARSYRDIESLGIRLPSGRQSGMTLLEVLTTCAVILILVSIALPSILQAKRKIAAATCLSNIRQLQISWFLYSLDFNEKMAPNVPGKVAGKKIEFASWVTGSISYGESEDNGNTDHLISGFGSIGPYNKAPKIYRCPSDLSKGFNGGKKVPRGRSYAMNCFLGDSPYFLTLGTPYRVFRKMGDLAAFSPASAWVFIDQHEDSIEDGYFWFTLFGSAESSWQEIPGSRHSTAANLVFADGHAESKRWVEPSTLCPVYGRAFNPISVPHSRDIQWLKDRTSVLKSEWQQPE